MKPALMFVGFSALLLGFWKLLMWMDKTQKNDAILAQIDRTAKKTRRNMVR